MTVQRFLVASLACGSAAVALTMPGTASAHFHWVPHYHSITEVYGTFPDAADPVVIREYCNGSESSMASFTHTDQFEASNGWGIGIGFSSRLVSSTLRFDVDRSYTVQGVYQQSVRPGTCVRLSRIEMYEVTWFQGKTSWPSGSEYALGMAGEFMYPTYSTRERSI